jgi:hypothetical protein
MERRFTRWPAVRPLLRCDETGRSGEGWRIRNRPGLLLGGGVRGRTAAFVMVDQLPGEYHHA